MLVVLILIILSGGTLCNFSLLNICFQAFYNSYNIAKIETIRVGFLFPYCLGEDRDFPAKET